MSKWFVSMRHKKMSCQKKSAGSITIISEYIIDILEKTCTLLGEWVTQTHSPSIPLPSWVDVGHDSRQPTKISKRRKWPRIQMFNFRRYGVWWWPKFKSWTGVVGIDRERLKPSKTGIYTPVFEGGWCLVVFVAVGGTAGPGHLATRHLRTTCELEAHDVLRTWFCVILNSIG